MNGYLTAKDVTFTWAENEQPWRGIWFAGAGASSSKLENCLIEHASGLCASYSCGYGVIFVGSSSPTISGCTIKDSTGAYGIWTENASPLIANNTITDSSSYGIYVTFNSSPTVSGNTITGHQYGIMVNNSSGTYQGNNLSGNQSAIYVNGSGSYLQNTIAGNDYGFDVYYSNSNNPVFSGNIYSNNTTADLNVSGNISTAVHWGETGDVVYTFGWLQITEGASLTIDSGRVVKGTGSGQITVYGTLT